MSTRFVRQFIKIFPNQYMEYINTVSNFESDIEANLALSNKAPIAIKTTYQSIRIDVKLEYEMIKLITIQKPNGDIIVTDCSFRYNTFIEVFDTLLIMLLLPSPKPLSQKKN